MLLAVDVGNTQTVFGLYEGAELGDRWRIATEAQRTGDELAALLSDFLDLVRARRASASPRPCRGSSASTSTFAERWAKAPLLVLGPGVATGIADPLRRPARGRARPDRERRRRDASATARR